MGKANKKNKNSKNNKTRTQAVMKMGNPQITVLKQKMESQMQAGSYEAALETLVELIEKKCYEPQMLYYGAQAYFRLGDYQRAASWVANTLQYASDHVEARLLLARICMLEDRIDDAMAIYTFVVQNNKLNNREREDIKEGTDYIWRTDREWMKNKYPLVANLWEDDNISLTSIDTGVKTCEKEAESVVDVNGLIEQVMAKEISLAAKVKILNTFAGGMFVDGDFVAAEQLLRKAVTIDSGDQQTIKNLAVAAKMQGQNDKALTYASKLQQTDFVLLKLLTD